MNECHKCQHFTERELGWCRLFDSTCMAARAVPTPVKTLEPGIPLFRMVDGRCGMGGKLWQAKPRYGHRGIALEKLR